MCGLCRDFYRPIGWHNNDALVDMETATGQYEEALLWCQREYSLRLGVSELLDEFRWVLFHNNAPYHSKRNLRLMCDTMHGKLSREQHEQLYERHAAQATTISAQNATTYTCPLYASLISVAAVVGAELVGGGCSASRMAQAVRLACTASTCTSCPSTLSVCWSSLQAGQPSQWRRH